MSDKSLDYGFDPGKSIFVYDIRYCNREATMTEWRVYDGLLLDAAASLCGSVHSYASRPALICYVDTRGSLQFRNGFHRFHRNGASCWVFAHEFEALAEEIERDFERRKLWREAMEDINRIRARLLR